MKFCAWKCAANAVFSGVIIPKVPRCHLLQQRISQQGLQKLIQESLSHQLTAYLSDFYLTFLLTFESSSFLKYNFIIILGICFDFDAYESFLECKSLEVLALCGTVLEGCRRLGRLESFERLN